MVDASDQRWIAGADVLERLVDEAATPGADWAGLRARIARLSAKGVPVFPLLGRDLAGHGNLHLELGRKVHCGLGLTEGGRKSVPVSSHRRRR